MSDLMLIGVLGMPMPDNPADLDVVTYMQFVSRARQAAAELQARTDALVDLLDAMDAVDAEAARVEQNGGKGWSAAPVIRMNYARDYARSLTRERD